MKKQNIFKYGAVAVLAAASFFVSYNVPVEPATPWQSIGGCGAGGSGGGSGDGIKWIGQGVSGGYLETEVFTTKENWIRSVHKKRSSAVIKAITSFDQALRIIG